MSQGDSTQETPAGADDRNSADDGRRELQDLRERMGTIKQEVAADVERKWTTPWRTPDVFDLKVATRLTGHTEYRALRVRVKQVEAALAVQPDAGIEKSST
ncbi:MAG: hypothetical protein ACREX8_03520 [Gammaproteobacteria bacterium]